MSEPTQSNKIDPHLPLILFVVLAGLLFTSSQAYLLGRLDAKEACAVEIEWWKSLKASGQ